MIELLGVSLDDIRALMVTNGFPAFRGKQIVDYIYKRHITTFADMTQLPKSLREWLLANCQISLPKVVARQVAPKGDTQKLLLELGDGSRIETVLMDQDYGLSVCVSSQVGCAMGCVFCASTTNGLLRNLTRAEIVGQVLLFSQLTGQHIHSIVMMGSGEPLKNYDEVVGALRIFHEPAMFGIGYRRMTLSTCGIIDGIRRLADEDMPITLALSLHAPNDILRKQIMPIGSAYALKDIFDALLYYYNKQQRRITFEYILINHCNASLKEAHQLGQLVKVIPNCHINLIPINGNEHIHMVKPSVAVMNQFKAIVESYGVPVTIRKEMGDAIKAACGQLKMQVGSHKESIEK